KEPNVPMNGLAEVERDHILRALAASNWVIGGRNGAAERLGMKRTSLVYRMKTLRIIRPAAVPQKRSASAAAGDDCVFQAAIARVAGNATETRHRRTSVGDL